MALNLPNNPADEGLLARPLTDKELGPDRLATDTWQDGGRRRAF